MLEGLVDLLSGGAIGSLLGTVGSLMTKRSERKMKALEFDHELNMHRAALAERKMELEAQERMKTMDIEEAKVIVDGEVEVAEIDAFKSSIVAGNQSTGIKAVDAVRALMRPVITILMIAGATWIGYEAFTYQTQVEASLSDGTLIAKLVNDTLFVAGTCITWWFGSRWSSNRK